MNDLGLTGLTLHSHRLMTFLRVCLRCRGGEQRSTRDKDLVRVDPGWMRSSLLVQRAAGTQDGKRSRMRVTGPSFVSDTFISAAKMPC